MSVCFQALGGEDEGNTELLKHEAANTQSCSVLWGW